MELFCPKFKCNRLDCPSGFGDLNLYHDGLLCNGDSSRFRQLGRSTEPQTSCRNVSVNEAGLCRLRLKYVNGFTPFVAFFLKHMHAMSHFCWWRWIPNAGEKLLAIGCSGRDSGRVLLWAILSFCRFCTLGKGPSGFN